MPGISTQGRSVLVRTLQPISRLRSSVITSGMSFGMAFLVVAVERLEYDARKAFIALIKYTDESQRVTRCR